MWRVALSLVMVGTSPGVRAGRQFIAKTEMATRCWGVGGEEVEVKCKEGVPPICSSTWCR